jgi:glutamine amidotransferase
MPYTPALPLVDVIDYGGGNLGSLTRALDRLKQPYRLVAGKETNTWPSLSAPLLLPGVGAFGAMMHALQQRGLVEALNEANAKAVPLLGICVGLQVLFEGSDESPAAAGLGWLAGRVVKLPCPKVPQIGWNWLNVRPADAQRWPEGYVYYVNSYVAQPAPASQQAVLYTSTYQGVTLCGGVQQGHLTAFQFHPEKSGDFGEKLLTTWLQTVAATVTV